MSTLTVETLDNMTYADMHADDPFMEGFVNRCKEAGVADQDIPELLAAAMINSGEFPDIKNGHMDKLASAWDSTPGWMKGVGTGVAAGGATALALAARKPHLAAKAWQKALTGAKGGVADMVARGLKPHGWKMRKAMKEVSKLETSKPKFWDEYAKGIGVGAKRMVHGKTPGSAAIEKTRGWGSALARRAGLGAAVGAPLGGLVGPAAGDLINGMRGISFSDRPSYFDGKGGGYSGGRNRGYNAYGIPDEALIPAAAGRGRSLNPHAAGGAGGSAGGLMPHQQASQRYAAQVRSTSSRMAALQAERARLTNSTSLADANRVQKLDQELSALQSEQAALTDTLSQQFGVARSDRNAYMSQLARNEQRINSFDQRNAGKTEALRQMLQDEQGSSGIGRAGYWLRNRILGVPWRAESLANQQAENAERMKRISRERSIANGMF